MSRRLTIDELIARAERTAFCRLAKRGPAAEAARIAALAEFAEAVRVLEASAAYRKSWVEPWD